MSLCTGENMERLYISEYLTRVTLMKPDRMPGITGISHKVYDFLMERPLLSLEIKSADNVNALSHVNQGDHIFLTPVLREDLLPKTEGVICQLKDKKVFLQKVKKWDEVEIVTVRIQVQPVCLGRVTVIEKQRLGEGVMVGGIERKIRCSIS